MGKKRFRWEPITEERKAYLLAKRADKKSLAESHPGLAQEWVHALDFDGNIDESKSPSTVTRGSIYKVLWQKECKPGLVHKWVTEIHCRANIGTGCPFCKKSIMEQKMLKTLQSLRHELGIDMIQHGVFVKRHNLYPDFFLILKNGKSCVIEMDGQQHFRPVSFGSKKDPMVMFQEVKDRDHSKNAVCKHEGWYMMRIDYTVDNNDYETLVRQFIENVKTENEWFMTCHGPHYDSNKVV
jgi:hypothetical protein